MKLLSKDARLKALENQINPHFLYNTLEAVNWRAKAIGAKRYIIHGRVAGHTYAGNLKYKR